MSIEKCRNFLNSSPTAFHAAENISRALDSAGYIRLNERESWSLQQGVGYYIVRNDSAVIAFSLGLAPERGFRIVGSHTDSPLLKIKGESEKYKTGGYQVATETYGGPILSTWFDRDLALAGRVGYMKEGSSKPCFATITLDKLRACLPSVAIHLNRDVNKGFEWNKQKHFNLLLSSQKESEGLIADALAEACGVTREEILLADFYAVPEEKATVINGEFLASGRIDNLSMCYESLAALPAPGKNRGNVMALWYDSEEIGSHTRQGGASSFLDDVLERICRTAGEHEDTYYRCKASSFLLSADGAHAVHPSFTDKHDPDYAPELNSGPVLKINAGRAYSTDVETGSEIIQMLKSAGIPFQKLIGRSDMPSGSTIGPIVSTISGIKSADMGIPMLAMHSAREMCGLKDLEYINRFFRYFWAS